VKPQFWVLVAAVMVVQLGFVPALHPLGVVPNLMIVLVVLTGLAGTASAALTVALIGGLLMDLTSGVDFGLRLGLLVLVALATGFVHRAGFAGNGLLVAWGLVTLATLMADVAVLLGLANAPTHWPLGWLAGRILIEVMLNLLGTLLLWPLVNRTVAREAGLTVLG
jgi:hypothetical protein